MKHIKLYENFKDIDIFDEENWDETEPDGHFLWWLKKEYPNQDTWKNIVKINCSNNNLIDLKGIENCINLKYLNCTDNELTNLNEIKNLINLNQLYISRNLLKNLNEIKNLTNLNYLYCYNNNFTNEYKEYLKNYCKEKRIYFDI